jgi:hypothetical protein
MRGSRRRQAYLLAGDDRCPFCCCLRHGADLSDSSGSDSPGRASGQPLPLRVALKTALLDAASHGSGEGQGKDPSLQPIGLDRLGGRDSNRSQKTPCPAEVPTRGGRSPIDEQKTFWKRLSSRCVGYKGFTQVV